MLHWKSYVRLQLELPPGSVYSSLCVLSWVGHTQESSFIFSRCLSLCRSL